MKLYRLLMNEINNATILTYNNNVNGDNNPRIHDGIPYTLPLSINVCMHAVTMNYHAIMAMYNYRTRR